METKIKIYYSYRNKNYFTTDKCICDGCNKEIEKHIVHFFYVTKKFMVEKCSHIHCINRIKKSGHIEERKLVVQVPMLPDDATLYVLRPPTLKDSNMTTTEAVYQIESAFEDKDKAWRSKRKDFMIDPDYIEYDKKQLEEKDKPLNTFDGLDLLDDIAKAEPVLTESEKKLLEAKNESKNN